MPSRTAVLLVAAVAAAGLTTPVRAATLPPSPAQAMRVGTLVLHRCSVTHGAYCGAIRRPWDPTGHEPGDVTVGFAFVPARDHRDRVLGTLVPHEGGPGYSTTGSASGYYVPMYGPLMQRRNLLLVDQRGTGRSEALDCPDLQRLHGAYAPAAGRCGRSLGDRSDDYTTAESADDLAAVVRALGLGPVDLYGDSYGTFFAQVFAGRHGGLLRSVVLDSAYPTYGETAWYPTQAPAMRQAFSIACARSPQCAQAGSTPMQLLSKVLDRVRQRPIRGVSHDADGRRMHVVVDGQTLVSVAFGATYGPYFYREFAAALRSSLLGDQVPLLRLVAEATGGSANAGPVRQYSEGLDAAVSCHDYPQLYDMTAPPTARRAQYADAIRAQEQRRPRLYGPFTIREYLGSDWEEQDWCTNWPRAAPYNPARPPRPPGGHYPNTPVLVLSGELDSITTPAEGAMVARQFPNARQVIVANSFHVTAAADTDGCAETVVRAFITAPSRRLTPGELACTHRVPPLRALGVFPSTLDQVPPARNLQGSHATLPERRAAAAAAGTSADLLDRWFSNYSGHGVGLRGGTWSYTGDRVTTFTLRDDLLVGGLAVSGTAVWARFANTLRIDVSVHGTDVRGELRGAWSTRAKGAVARLRGTLDGHRVAVSLIAP